MDLGRFEHYVGVAMEFLLTLFAMLGAVTGAFSGVGGPEPGLHRAEAAVGAQLVAATVEQQAEKVEPPRPAAEPPSREVQPLPAFAVTPAAPLYADRLIE